MIAARSRLILLLLGSVACQVAVLGLLGDEIDIPLGRVGVPSSMAWCFPASLSVGLVIESHTEPWDWENRSRVAGVEGVGAGIGAIVSVAAFRTFQHAFPPTHVCALWALLVAVGTCLRRALGQSAWLAAFVSALIVFYGLATPGSVLLDFVIDHASVVTFASAAAIAIVRLWPRQE
jgi:hypothetical protein